MTAWFRNWTLGLILALPGTVIAEIQTREIPYEAADGTRLVGYYAYDDSLKGKRPGVIVVHEWWGLNDYARSRARDLAKLGYAALAIDMYGEGKHTMHAGEATAMMQAATRESGVAQARAKAGLTLLKRQPEVNPAQIAAIGYCFGGKVVLDMARQGMDLDGVVSFHGTLSTTTPAEKGKVKAKVLVLNGEDDSFISAKDIQQFKQEMEAAGVDYTVVNYPDAKHGFTNPGADRLARENTIDLAYNAQADAASWRKMQQFLQSLFQPRSSSMKGN